jgi:ATP synthase F1 complex assembly factor 2
MNSFVTWTQTPLGRYTPLPRFGHLSSLTSMLMRSFPEDHPSTLVSLQEKNWVPLHQYFEKVHGIKIKSYENLVLGGGQKFRQDQKTRDVLRRVVESWDAWQIAGMSPSFALSRCPSPDLLCSTGLERATYATKSFLTAFALVAGQSTADVAAQAAMVEVQSQIDLWGEVEDCESSSTCFAQSLHRSLIRVIFPAHDVDHQEIRRQLGSVSCILINN